VSRLSCEYGLSWASCQPRFESHLAWTMCSLKIRPKPGSASIRSLALPDTRRSASEISNRRTEGLVLNLRQAYALAGPARAAWQRRLTARYSEIPLSCGPTGLESSDALLN